MFVKHILFWECIVIDLNYWFVCFTYNKNRIGKLKEEKFIKYITPILDNNYQVIIKDFVSL